MLKIITNFAISCGVGTGIGCVVAAYKKGIKVDGNDARQPTMKEYVQLFGYGTIVGTSSFVTSPYIAYGLARHSRASINIGILKFEYTLKPFALSIEN